MTRKLQQDTGELATKGLFQARENTGAIIALIQLVNMKGDL